MTLWRRLPATVAAGVLPWTAVLAQGRDTSVVAFQAAGGEAERYLRVEQLANRLPWREWSIRGFGPVELESMRDTAGVWSRAPRPRARMAKGIAWHAAPIDGSVILNTGFPYGMNDGPVWAGRGVTASVQGGIAARRGWVSAALQPVAFITQNAAIPLAPVGLPGDAAYANSATPLLVDLPQRFGSGPYARVDPGESYVRADIRFASVGLSTASQVYGPAIEHPLILGNNAGGFPHVFLGSSHPLDLGLVRVHGRFVWGVLSGSKYAPPSSYTGPGDPMRRFATSLVGTISSRHLPGFELGAIRFFHSGWPAGGVGDLPFLNVLQGILKSGLPSTDDNFGDVPTDNQLASVFFRWAFPSAGFETYMEFGREDHSWNLRDFWGEPDHDAGYLLGFQRVWKRDAEPVTTVVRGEHLNTRLSHLQSVAPQFPWYVHGVLTQGHTQRGQSLGSVGGHGGGATTVAVDRYSPSGRSTLRWDRTMRGELRGEGSLPVPEKADVLHGLSVERVRFFDRGLVGTSVSAVADFNRNFGNDAFGARVAVWSSITARRQHRGDGVAR